MACLGTSRNYHYLFLINDYLYTCNSLMETYKEHQNNVSNTTTLIVLIKLYLYRNTEILLSYMEFSG